MRVGETEWVIYKGSNMDHQRAQKILHLIGNQNNSRIALLFVSLVKVVTMTTALVEKYLVPGKTFM